MNKPFWSVIVPTHNPSISLLGEVLRHIASQKGFGDDFEILIVDNASRFDLAWVVDNTPHTRLLRESQVGLTHARLRGVSESSGKILCFFDDDNLPANDYLKQAAKFADAHPNVGCFGGKCIPDFETHPPEWFESTGLSLGCRDHGGLTSITPSPSKSGVIPRNYSYPVTAPIGAGMVLRREVAELYRNLVNRRQSPTIHDRSGTRLSSAGDCDIVLSALANGWAVAYTPHLMLRHRIPSRRLKPTYLSRLAFDSSESWVHLLALWGINPWPPAHPLSIPLRQLRAFFRLRAWSGWARFIRWRGACGVFRARGSLYRR